MSVEDPKSTGLADSGPKSPEIYETPGLTDDSSTIQTTTVRTPSPEPFDEQAPYGLDRSGVDQDEARRVFEPARVNARNVNFSDNIANRRSYKTRSRARRKRTSDGGEEIGDLSDDEEESLEQRIARLKQETAEAYQALQRREQDSQQGDNQGSLQAEISEINNALDGLGSLPSGQEQRHPAEAALTRKLGTEHPTDGPATSSPLYTDARKESTAPPTTVSSLASISDRITLLESSLGISHGSTLPAGPLLPTLTSLSAQITALTTTLSPPSTAGPHTPQTANLNLDDITHRLHDLSTQADRLTTSRKAAIQAASDLRQSQLKAAMSSRPMHTDPAGPTHSRNSSQHHSSKGHPASQVKDLTTTELLGYEDQSTKVAALYSLLPRIQELSPLLPLVVERLRSLQVIHTGAAQARGDLDRIEQEQVEMGKEIEEWSSGLQKVEALIGNAEGKMKENLDVVGEMVQEIEKRVGKMGG